MKLPPRFDSRSESEQLLLAIAVPAIFGIVTGVVLGLSEIAYLVLSLLGILGGYFAGLEHRGGDEGALRGFAGGFLFGSFILAAHGISGMDPKAELPHPEILLVVITTLAGIGLGALGGRARRRRERRERMAQRAASATGPAEPPAPAMPTE